MSIALNIHDILSVQIEGSSLSDIKREVGYFNTDSISNPDIHLSIGSFEPEVADCNIVEGKYYVRDGYVYYTDSSNSASWNIQVNITDAPIELKVDSTVTGIKNRLLHRNYVAKELLIRTIERELFERGYVLLHSAAIARNDTGYLFYGRGGSFKTTLLMDLIRDHGYGLVGDDHVIVGEEGIYSFPENIPIFEYMVQNLKTERHWSFRDKAEFVLRSVSGSQLQNAVEISDHCTIEQGFYLSKHHSNSLRIGEDNNSFEKMHKNNRMEDFVSPEMINVQTGLFTKCDFAQTIATGAEGYFSYDPSDLLESHLQSIPFGQIRLPMNYNNSYANEIHTVIT